MKKLTAIALLSLLILPANGFAAGAGAFENATYSAVSLAEGNAMAARADEPAAISYNPAGIAYLRGVQGQNDLGLISIVTNIKQNGDKAHYEGGTISPVPTSYLTVNSGKFLNERLTLGIGSDAPFGLVTRYDSNLSSTRYTGYTNILKMFAIKPVAAVKLHEKFSIAAGPIFYRIFDLEQVAAYPNSAAVAGLPDGQLRVTGTAKNWGWHMGALAKIHPKHQFGFYFRSPVTMLAKGKIQVERSSFHPNGQFETRARAKIDLPMDLTFGYAFLPTEKTSVETDFTFSRWSAFKRLYITPDVITNPPSTVDDAILNSVGASDRDYTNNYVIHLGGRHKFTDKFTGRAGSLFSWTPIPAHSFTPAIPDSNSLALMAGFSYVLSQHFQFDFAYMARFWFQRSVNNDISESVGGTVDGKYSSFGQEVMLGLKYRFDDIFVKKQTGMSQDTSEGGSKTVNVPPAKNAAKATPQARSQKQTIDAMNEDLERLSQKVK